jgi:hypothetical protein
VPGVPLDRGRGGLRDQAGAVLPVSTLSARMGRPEDSTAASVPAPAQMTRVHGAGRDGLTEGAQQAIAVARQSASRHLVPAERCRFAQALSWLADRP